MMYTHSISNELEAGMDWDYMDDCYASDLHDSTGPHWTTLPYRCQDAFESVRLWSPGMRPDDDDFASDTEGSVESFWSSKLGIDTSPEPVAEWWATAAIYRLYPGMVIEVMSDCDPSSFFYIPKLRGFRLQSIDRDGRWETVSKHDYETYEAALEAATAHNKGVAPYPCGTDKRRRVYVVPVSVADKRESENAGPDDASRQADPEIMF